MLMTSEYLRPDYTDQTLVVLSTTLSQGKCQPDCRQQAVIQFPSRYPNEESRDCATGFR